MSEVRATDVGLDALTPALAGAYAYWESRQANDIGPAWNDIDLFDLPSAVLPTTMIVDVKPNMGDNVFRFWGSELTTIHGRDMTGRCPYDIRPVEFGRRLLEGHTRVVAERRPHIVAYDIFSLEDYIHSHIVLRMPLSADGKTVSHIIVCADYSDTALEYFKTMPISPSDFEEPEFR